MLTKLVDFFFGESELGRHSDSTQSTILESPPCGSADFASGGSSMSEGSAPDYSNAWNTACPHQVTAECGSAFPSHDFTHTTFSFGASSAFDSVSSSTFDSGSSVSWSGPDLWP